MNAKQKQALEAAGFRVGDADDFLELTPEERAMVGLRVAVAKAVRRLRERSGLTQAALAEKMGSSQSRVAKIEAGGKGVSLELGFRSVFAAGGSVADVIDRPATNRNRPSGRSQPS